VSPTKPDEPIQVPFGFEWDQESMYCGDLDSHGKWKILGGYTWVVDVEAYRRVYDSRHLQADCQEPGSAPELSYARYSSMG